jgi:hypothetical protein
MSRSAKTSTALAVVSDQEIASAAPVEQLKAVAVREFYRVAQSEQENALRAILLGLTLHKIKASLAHGEFTPWVKNHLAASDQKRTEVRFWSSGTASRNAQYFMRLALVAVAATDATKPELLALPGDQAELHLDTTAAEAHHFMAKLGRFVGERSLNELLREHGIKDSKPTGGRRERTAAQADAEPITPERLAAQAREELSEWCELGRQLLITDNVCSHLQPEEVRAFYDGLHSMLEHWRKHMRTILRAD